MSCFGHNLDLAVRKSWATDQIPEALVRLRKLISGINRSCKRKAMYLTKQAEKGLPRHETIHDKPTRWGSTYEMVDRFLEQQSAICAALVEDRKCWSLMPTDADITVYDTLKQVLGPINELTDAVSGKRQVTISCVQPVLWKISDLLTIKKTDNELPKVMKQVLSDDLEHRYSDDRIPLLLTCAAYLNARFKNTFVSNAGSVKEKLTRDIMQLASRPNVPFTEAP